jgi:hypothetical protein
MDRANPWRLTQERFISLVSEHGNCRSLVARRVHVSDAGGLRVFLQEGLCAKI